MTRATLDQRLARREHGCVADALSPAVRRWLGHPLTPVEQALADGELKILATRRIDMSALSPAARTWLADRDDLAGDRTTQSGDHR